MSRTYRKPVETRRIKPYLLAVTNITGKHKSAECIIKSRYNGYDSKNSKSCDKTFPSKRKRTKIERRMARSMLKHYDDKHHQ